MEPFELPVAGPGQLRAVVSIQGGGGYDRWALIQVWDESDEGEGGFQCEVELDGDALGKIVEAIKETPEERAVALALWQEEQRGREAREAEERGDPDAEQTRAGFEEYRRRLVESLKARGLYGLYEDMKRANADRS
jgi:hypothetical protein